MVPSIRRGYYEEQFKTVETKVCDHCGAGPGQQCWDVSSFNPYVAIERVVPHIERFEAWSSEDRTGPSQSDSPQ